METTTVSITRHVRRKRAAAYDNNNDAGDKETVSAIITIHGLDAVNNVNNVNNKGRNNTGE